MSFADVRMMIIFRLGSPAAPERAPLRLQPQVQLDAAVNEIHSPGALHRLATPVTADPGMVIWFIDTSKLTAIETS